MDKKTIFIFEATAGMVLAGNVYDSDGHMVVPAETVLDLDIIAKISNYHVLEIDVYDGVVEPVAPISNPLRETTGFKEFSQNYLESVAGVKDYINRIIYEQEDVDTHELLEDVSKLLSGTKSALHLFDMLNCMREFDDSTYVHCINVSLIATIIGRWLNYSPEDIDVLTLAGLLHDIGKVQIPDEVLKKPGKLTDEEYQLIKTHVNQGYEKLKNQALDTRIKEACLLHHERSDGSGYPFGLQSDKIPQFAKIISIADVYDAMTASRVYRTSVCPFDVIKMMESDAFSKFDPNFLLPFLNNVVASYLHTNVNLSNGKTGEVVLINRGALSLPVVKCEDTFIDLSKDRSVSIVSMI